MSTDPRPAQPLPNHPNLEQQKKRARELLNAAQALEPDALRRFAANHPRCAGALPPERIARELSLHDAQLVIAREYGFASWPKLKAHIDALAAGPNPVFERYTEQARRVLFFSRHEASQLGSTSIDAVHLLLGLLKESPARLDKTFASFQLTAEGVQKEVPGEAMRPTDPSAQIFFSSETKRVLQNAVDESTRLSHHEIGVEHLLLGILRQERSTAASILMAKGMRLNAMREEFGDRKTMTPVGLTSRWIAASRALETETANPLFSDPFARQLAGEPGFAMLSTMRTAMGAPAIGPELYLSIRTRFFDDALIGAVRQSSIGQVVILAAGMDTRAFRLDWPPGLVLFEIDRDDVLEHKEAVLTQLNAQATCERRIVRADLSGPWSDALINAGFSPARPAAFLAEGLLYYLDEPTVIQLFKTLTDLAPGGAWLGLDIVNTEMLVSRYMAAYVKTLDELGCPWKFGIDDPKPYLAAHGWRAALTEPGEPDANYGRWPYPVHTRTVAGLPINLPRTFLVRADRLYNVSRGTDL